MDPLSDCLHPPLARERVSEGHHVEHLRLVRNECRAGFAHDTREVSAEDQKLWWARHVDADAIRAWLYFVPGGFFYGSGAKIWKLAGYGLVREEGGRWWSSVAVSPEHAGRGLGGRITADLIRQVPFEVHGSARLDQPKAVALHREEDWEEVARDERLVTFRTRSRWAKAVLDAWAEGGGPFGIEGHV